MFHLLWEWTNLYFGWPGGFIWPNVIANPIVIGLSVWVATLKVKLHLTKQHEERLEQAQTHHDEQMEKLDIIHAHVKTKRHADH